ncbi:hypothetical protein TNCV_2090161 [Trichonephila clavipes]|nr:hypothetical protein TNCV_2090161 [Trichonephila clavipes]
MLTMIRYLDHWAIAAPVGNIADVLNCNLLRVGKKCHTNVRLLTLLGPAVKRNGAPDNNSGLRVCVACDSESRTGTLSWASPETSSMIARTQFEARFVAQHYRSPVSMIPI